MTGNVKKAKAGFSQISGERGGETVPKLDLLTMIDSKSVIKAIALRVMRLSGEFSPLATIKFWEIRVAVELSIDLSNDQALS